MDIENNVEAKKNNIRMIRNRMLSFSDRFMLEDFPLYNYMTKDGIKIWRQYLRDYTKLSNWWEKEPLDYPDWFNNINNNLYEE